VRYGDRLRDGVSTTGGGLAAGAAVPDTDGLTLDSVLTAELAHVAGVLCDLGESSTLYPSGDARFLVYTHFHLLDLLTERGTVTGTVLSGDANLLSAYQYPVLHRSSSWGSRTLGHFGGVVWVDWWVDEVESFVVAQFRSCGQRLSGYLGGALLNWDARCNGSTLTDISECRDPHHQHHQP
jgi:hypothetical protein